MTDVDGAFNNDSDGYSRVCDRDGDGVLDAYEKALRAMASEIYSTLNTQGGI